MTFHFRMLLMSCAVALFGVQHAAAQSVEVFGGYTITNMRPEQTFNRTSMNGWNTSITGYPTSRFGITADFAGFYTTVNSTSDASASSQAVSLRQYSFMAGPQFRLVRTKRFETSFRAIFGGAHGYVPDSSVVPAGIPALTYNPLDQTTFAALFGSNFDFNVSRRVALRFSPGLYLTQYGANETQKNFRFSVGPVFRFGHGD